MGQNFQFYLGSVQNPATGWEMTTMDIACVPVGINGNFLKIPNTLGLGEVSQFMMVLPKCA